MCRPALPLQEGRRRVENSGEIAALLRRRYPAAKVQTVSFDRRPDLTVTEQVRLLWFMGSAG